MLAGVTGTCIEHDYSDFDRPTTAPTMGAIEKDNPLPVFLSSFTSNISGRNVKLNWITASEQNNSGFEIQRAVVSIQFSVKLDMYLEKGQLIHHQVIHLKIEICKQESTNTD